MEKIDIPQEVQNIGIMLTRAGYQAYLVGGCVRDFLCGTKPKDLDIATNAIPEQIQKLFPDSVYENNFGTVGIKTNSEDVSFKIIEVTTFRIEGSYSDARHPDEVKFAKTIEEDLARRDFTVNALALEIGKKTIEINKNTLVDPYGGQEDLKKKIIRAVGDPEKRFTEDALRMMRAVRFVAQLGFSIEEKTGIAMKKNAKLLEVIAKERIRDEVIKIIMTPRAADGIRLLEKYILLVTVFPELCEGIICEQNKHHIYTVFDHNVRALHYAAEQNYSLAVRLAALLHDVGKPRTKRGEGANSTFHGHEVVGARIATKILDRLHFSKEIIETAVHLVRYHMFYYNVGDVSDAGVRRFVKRVGPEYIDDLLKVREADRIGSGVPKAVPYKLRHLLFMMEKVKHDPLHPKMLVVKGDEIMALLKIPAGPRVGNILSILLEDVLDDPTRNTKEYLVSRIHELHTCSDKELRERAIEAREEKDVLEEKLEKDMKRQYHV